MMSNVKKEEVFKVYGKPLEPDFLYALNEATLKSGKRHIVPGILIEGADQSFKSSICQKLSIKLNLPVIHHGKTSDKVAEEYDYLNGYFQEIEENPGKSFIYDRSYLSEITYGSVIRGFSRISPELQKQIEDRFHSLGYFLVLLDRPDNSGDWIQRPEYIKQEQNQAIKEKYREVYETVSLDKMKINPEEENVVERIIEKWTNLNSSRHLKVS